MKLMVLLILVVLLLADLAEDSCLGKLKVYLPPSDKTTVTSSHHHGSNKTDLRHKLAFIDLLGTPCHCNVSQ
jgi:predicted small lipoprotein YifL